MGFESILNKQVFSKCDLIRLLNCTKEEQKLLFAKSREVMLENIGNHVFLRGLIELSNYCIKDCLYCGIRKGNHNVTRYTLELKDVLSSAKFAYQKGYGSIVLQSGERSDSQFVETITHLIKEIKKLSNNELGITISLGEQTRDTYQEWFNAGAHRYLLRIESSNKELYEKLHPQDALHSYLTRLDCLNTLKSIGYQVGTGVMIGLPFQSIEHLAEDLLFFKALDVDMVGMGPYIEHEETPLFVHKDGLWPIKRRFELSLNMIAILRLMMRDINIVATTALQAIDPVGREKALKIGANIIMPNITPTSNRKNYSLYQDKPCTDEGAEDCSNCLNIRIELAGGQIGYGDWGDSHHFTNNVNKSL